MVVTSVLDESLNENDMYNSNSFDKLLKLGLKDDEALILLASHKSLVKYGYRLSLDTLRHILSLYQGDIKFSPIKSLINVSEILQLIEITVFLMEHVSCSPDGIMEYWNVDLNKELIDFVASLSRGILPIDQYAIFPEPIIPLFHYSIIPIGAKPLSSSPFLFAKTGWIYEHAPSFVFYNRYKQEELDSCIVKFAEGYQGPYSPFPNPDNGKPLFYNPLACLEPQRETIFLARDIGAGSVVVHLIDLSGIKEMADLIMNAAGSPVRVTIENYCETEERQDADTFLGTSSGLIPYI